MGKKITLGVIIVIAIGVAVAIFGNSHGQLFSNSDNTMNSSTPQERVLSLTSPAFAHNSTIPERYSCDSEQQVNPELHISGIPDGTESLVLLMDDPDIPQQFKEQRGIDDFDHWALFNIPSTTTVIAEGEAVGVPGVNGRGENAYAGPCPPPEFEPTEHRYFFKLFALNDTLNLEEGATHEEIRAAMNGKVVAETELVGRYDRSN